VRSAERDAELRRTGILDAGDTVGASLNCASLRSGACRLRTSGRTPMSPGARVTTS
jgi:hypothetical protein